MVNIIENRKRPCRVIVHLTITELKELNNKCKMSGYKREKYIRSLLNGYVPSEKANNDFSEVIFQLRKIGNNINQLTMLAHQSKSINYQDLKEELNYLNQSIGDLREKVLLPRSIE